MKSTQWAFNALAERIGEQNAAEALAGGLNDYDGLEGLEHELVQLAADEMAEKVAAEQPDSRAFNDVVVGWRRGAKTRFAAYVCSETDILDDDGFREELERFARSGNHLDEDGNYHVPNGDSLDTELFVYDTNPYDDDQLNQDEAELVIEVRTRGLDESALDFAQIHDYEDFKWWLDETNNVELAIKCHLFHPNINASIAEQLKHPDEWEELNPQAPPSTCYECGEQVVYGEVEGEEEPKVVCTNGSTDGEILELGREFFAPEASQAFLCSLCYQRTRDSEGSRCLHFRTQSGEEVRVGTIRAVHKDYYFDDMGTLPVAELSGDERILVKDLLARNGDAGTGEEAWYRVSPQPGTEGSRIAELVRGHRTLPMELDGPFAIEFDYANHVAAWFPSNRPEAAKRLKDIMENGTESSEVSA